MTLVTNGSNEYLRHAWRASTLAFAVLAACGGGVDVDTSTNAYCRDFYDQCPRDALKESKLDACEEECTMGVQVASEWVRQSSCWKAVCSLELGICQEYKDNVEDTYTTAVIECAKEHGWYDDI